MRILSLETTYFRDFNLLSEAIFYAIARDCIPPRKNSF